MASWRACVLAVASLVVARPTSAQPAIALVPYATGLSSPVALAAPADGSGRLFIVQQGGRIRIHDGTTVLATPFLDLTPLVVFSGEQGLLGLTFHPNYPATPFFFVNYTCRSGSADCPSAGDTIIARYSVSANPNVADPASRRVMLVIDQPFANHNAGDLKFGADGYLWIPMGDGGSGGDPFCFAQRDDSLLGKVLRIDVNQNVNTPPFYGIPPDNPYIGPGDPRDEVYARGLRNPFRFSFDRLTGDVFIGDVGQGAREEIDFTAVGTGAARNYGWKVMEGTLCTGSISGCPVAPPACNSPAYTLPILEYDHGQGDCAVIGGFRYRGTQVPAIAARYLYSDNCTGKIRAGTEGPPGTWAAAELIDTPYNISSFGEDQAGELYVTALNTGVVYRIVSGGPATVSVGDAAVTEGDAGSVNVVFTVSLSAAVAQTVTVQYATADGTASAGADYVAAAGTLTFPAGTVVRTVVVPVLGDLLDEDIETFTVNLSNPTNATLADGQGVGTITDNDPPPSLSVGDCAATEGDTGATPCAFTVVLAPVSGRAVTVAFATADGTATAGADYAATSGTLTFPAGTTQQAVNVSVVGDLIDEPDETFTLNLSNPTNATLADGQGVGTITDNDPLPSLLAGDCAVVEGNAGSTPCAFTVLLSAASAKTVSVNYATGDGTANAGTDYTAAAGTLTFPPGTTQQTVNADVLGDAVVEPDETFFLNLTAPLNAMLADAQGTGTILDDDAPSLSTLEVSHGSAVRADLAGGTPDLYRLSQRPRASYEVVLDEVSGDAVPGLLLERLASDNVTVLQTAIPVGTGSALSLRWENTVAATVNGQTIRLQSPACGTSCGADDVYRLRVYDTTFSIARFNNAGSQVTVVVLQNPTSLPVSGHVHFWSGSGTLLLSHPVNLAGKATLVVNSATLAALQAQSGSVTLSHDAPHAALAGKTVALEPATGFSFDSPLEPRLR